MELYLIRHGQSTNNALGDIPDIETQRVADSPLSDLGHQQATALAHYLTTAVNADALGADRPAAGFGLTRLYASPMTRTLQTVRPLSQAVGLPVNVWVEIHEHGGLYLTYPDERGTVGFPGRTRSEILADYPDYLLPDDITEAGWWNPANKGEDITGCYARAVRVAQTLRQWAGTPERIAIITHGTFTVCLLKAFLDMVPSHHIFYTLNNTAISRLDFAANGDVTVRYINRVDHLPPELVS